MTRPLYALTFVAVVFGPALWTAARLAVANWRMRGVPARIAGWCLWAVLRAYATTRPKRAIRAPDGTALLTRWFLTSRPDGVSTGTSGWYLHRLEHYDTLRTEHNHPWRESWTRVLRGWYVETRCGTHFTRCVGDVVTFASDTFHRITHVRPDTWTLFYAGPKHGRGWGFACSHCDALAGRAP